MKRLADFVRIISGALLIFSGLIKLNDPYGLAYKLKEYFEVFSDDFHSFFHLFIPFSLSIAFAICVIEIVLGFSLLLKYRLALTSRLLLLIIAFFTFLTFYSAYFDKVRECGCFGNFLIISPWESFAKDLILLVFSGIIFSNRKNFRSKFNNPKGDFIVGVVAVFCVFLGYYSLEHLPFFDFRPYALGKNIPEQMKPEEEAEFIYIMTKNGKEYTFKNYPTDTTFKYKSYMVLNPEKSQPKITDYRVWNDEGDFTDSSFYGIRLLVIIHDAKEALNDKDELKDGEKIASLVKTLETSGIESMILTASTTENIENFRHETQLAVPYFYVDDTQLKTMIRTNEGLILLKDGTVKGKWHHNDVPSKEEILRQLN